MYYDALQFFSQLIILSTLLPAAFHSVSNRDKTNRFLVTCVFLHCLQHIVHQFVKQQVDIVDGLSMSTDHMLMLKLYNSYSIAHTLTHQQRLIPFSVMFGILHYCLCIAVMLAMILRPTENVHEFSMRHVLFLLFIGEIFGFLVQIACNAVFVLSDYYEYEFLTQE